ncbi:DUF4386 domain-containing protein [Robertkochia marina]|uniref:DUF4386 domain-containing protein n=1 Tax=Robertkochia marina TaxID=1227945 RepID=A0A4S3M1K9_9FLAO|nr:DUF4386 domain-containing protein [Robertkochia marina]THD68984.1 DUF4386 domain-containing protein [Robertkochia marina]TRZ44806.1 DUF4386 domain-containing protein [Robertkochia marina]
MDVTENRLSNRVLSLIAGWSYILIFLAAIYANFFMLESLKAYPLQTLEHHQVLVRSGIIAFLLTAVLDVVVAWTLNELFRSHSLTPLSTWLRIIHAVLMGGGVFALVMVFYVNTETEILYQVEMFNAIWLIGLFFFGFHLILLGIIMKSPRLIAGLLIVAGIMYIADTNAHFLMEDYDQYADTFLMLVAVPSVLGEMSLAVWLLVKGGRQIQPPNA